MTTKSKYSITSDVDLYGYAKWNSHVYRSLGEASLTTGLLGLYHHNGAVSS